MIRHLLGYSNNCYTEFGDKLVRVKNYSSSTISMIKDTFNDYCCTKCIAIAAPIASYTLGIEVAYQLWN